MIKIFVTWLALIIFASTAWLYSFFGTINFDQFLYHAWYSLSTLQSADPIFLKSFLIYCLLGPCLVIVSLKFISTRIKSPVKFSKFLPLGLLAAATFNFLYQISFWSWLTSPDPFSIYVSPDKITPPAKKRNLILIYVESLEATYTNQQVFGQNLLKSLDKITSGWHTFNYQSAPGATWTMGGIVASQCGVPLQEPQYKSKRNLGHVDNIGTQESSFMPGILCLGDVLQSAGYINAFLGGARLQFASKEKFLRSHGYSVLWGKAQWDNLALNTANGWGLLDDELFSQAKKILTRLVKENQPFNLTLLTVNTHSPHGFVDQFCSQKGAHNFTHIVTCTGEEVANFLSFIKKNNFDKNTDIVVIGDHLAMINPLIYQLTNQSKRFIYNKFYSSQPLVRNRETINPFSIYPTILYMLGFRFKDNRLALGVSAFGFLNPQFEQLNPSFLGINQNKYKQYYAQFWKKSSA